MCVSVTFCFLNTFKNIDGISSNFANTFKCTRQILLIKLWARGQYYKSYFPLQFLMAFVCAYLLDMKIESTTGCPDVQNRGSSFSTYINGFIQQNVKTVSILLNIIKQ